MATTACATTYGEANLAAHVETWTLYAALMSVAGGNTGASGTEFDAVDYDRQVVTFAADPLNDGKLVNTAAIEWGTPATDWGDAAEVRLFDALTSGEAQFYMTLSPAVACDAGAPVLIPAGQLTITFM